MRKYMSFCYNSSILPFGAAAIYKATQVMLLIVMRITKAVIFLVALL